MAPGASQSPRRGRYFPPCAVIALGIAGAIGCNDSAPALGGALCTYQQTIGCTGADGCQGVSTCLPDLSSYGECVCPGDGGAARGDAGMDASPPRDGGAKDGSR